MGRFDWFIGDKGKYKKMKEAVLFALTERSPQSVPSICKRINSDNKFQTLRCIADLENEKKVILDGFDRTFYGEGGGAIYLALYRLVDENEETKTLKYYNCDNDGNMVKDTCCFEAMLGYSQKKTTECCGTCEHWQDLATFGHDGKCDLGKKITKFGDECTVEI